jgi:hypothetical protein
MVRARTLVWLFVLGVLVLAAAIGTRTVHRHYADLRLINAVRSNDLRAVEAALEAGADPYVRAGDLDLEQLAWEGYKQKRGIATSIGPTPPELSSIEQLLTTYRR